MVTRYQRGSIVSAGVKETKQSLSTLSASFVKNVRSKDKFVGIRGGGGPALQEEGLITLSSNADDKGMVECGVATARGG